MKKNLLNLIVFRILMMDNHNNPAISLFKKGQLTVYIFLFLSFFAFENIKAQTQFWSDTFEFGSSSSTRTTEENGVVKGLLNTSYYRLAEGSTISQVVSFTGVEGSNYWASEAYNEVGTDFSASGAGGAATNSAFNELTITRTDIDNFRLSETAPIVAPTVNTTAATGVGALTATLGGDVTSDGGETLTERGIVWATTVDPTTSDNKVTIGTGIGSFSSLISSLPPATLINFRAYAINSADTGYGANLTFTTNAALSATTSQTNVSCNGGSNGTASVTASGGFAPYSYSWSPSGGTGATASGLVAGDYTCTITDSELTQITKNFTVTQPTAINTSSGSQTNVSCNGGTNGSASVSPSGGTPGYTYSWSPSGGTAATATGLAAGSYTVTVTDANGCTATRNYTITQPSSINTASGSQTNVSCNGGTNGSASVSPSGGTPGYSYSWSPSGGTAATATGLAAGSYTVTVTDANGCTATRNYTITQPSSINTASGSQTNVSCNGGTNGSASVSPSGGTPGYTYSWSPSGGTAATATGLAAGSYTVTVTDANGCTATRNYTITQPSSINTASGSQTNVSCNGGTNGSASVSPSGGTPGYTYSWSPSGGTAATATGLAAGSYTVTVTDANGCTATRNYIITQPSSINTASGFQTNVSCNGGSNGSASVFPTGGTPGYTYSWSPSGGTAATATGLVAGSYTVTVTDANGCMATRNFTITESSVITDITSQTNVSCNGGSNGSASVIASGGTPGYTYSWSPSGGTAAEATGLTAGTYTCTITDANSCTVIETFIITEPLAITATTSQTNLSCNGGSNGSASVIASGGTPGYTYSWSPSGGTAAEATGLSAGTYICTITDANSCSVTETFIITEPLAITNITSQTNVSCNGGSNGSASVIASGGTPGYTYSWSPSGGTAAEVTGLSAGTYVCTITDVNSCSVTETFIITEPSVITTVTSQTDITCSGDSNGSASVIASGGTPGYTYSWSPSGGTAAEATGLSAGTYICTITDANSCSKTETFIISEPLAITAVTAQSNVSCNGGSNGSASVIASGGTPGYTYSWVPAGGTEDTATGLMAGTYICNITDANSCLGSETFIITEPSVIAAVTSQTNVSCNGGSNGSASVIASGGTPGYTYSWSPSGGTAAEATGLSAGTYVCTITDANFCSVNQTFTITEPTAITAVTSQIDVSCNGGSNGSASVIASGGVPGYTYSWSPSGGTAAEATGLSAGTYLCTITDASSCSVTETFIITELLAITAETLQSNVTCNGGSNGSASVIASGGTPGYTYFWSPSGETVDMVSGLTAGTYTCTITDAGSCSLNKTIIITEPLEISASISRTNITCNGGSDGSASVIVYGGTPGYTYFWAPSGGTGTTATGLTAGTNTCTITDANACTSTESFVLTEPAAINSSVFVSGCDSIVVNNITYHSGGTYTQVLSAANGCDSTLTIMADVSQSLTSSKVIEGCNSVSYNGVTYNASGAYTQRISNEAGCDSIITILAVIDTLDLSVTLSNDTAMANQNGAIYQWIDCGNENSILPFETNQTFVPKQSGSYAVIINNGTCTDTSACQSIIVTGVKSKLSNPGIQVSVYPNPTPGVFTLDLIGFKNPTVPIKVFSVTGALIYQSTTSNAKAVIDITKQINGIYILQVVTDVGIVEKRIVKQK
jgi:hypothetical protein